MDRACELAHLQYRSPHRRGAKRETLRQKSVKSEEKRFRRLDLPDLPGVEHATHGVVPDGSLQEVPLGSENKLVA